MNVWAASNTQQTEVGVPWRAYVDFSSQHLLVGDSWGLFGRDTRSGDRVYYSSSSFGFRGQPGERFGGGVGVNDFPGDAFASRGRSGAPEMEPRGRPTSYIPYYRHPQRRGNTFDLEGGAHFAFADGHGDRIDAPDLTDGSPEGFSSLQALWSPADFRLVQEQRDDG